jgi:hypothetical protein
VSFRGSSRNTFDAPVDHVGFGELVVKLGVLLAGDGGHIRELVPEGVWYTDGISIAKDRRR